VDPDSTPEYRFGPFSLPSSQVFFCSLLSFATVNLKPVKPGHALILPKRIVPRFGELTTEEISEMWIMAAAIGNMLTCRFSAPALTYAIQDGPLAGQSVPHVHIHLLPRKHRDFQRNDGWLITDKTE